MSVLTELVLFDSPWSGVWAIAKCKGRKKKSQKMMPHNSWDGEERKNARNCRNKEMHNGIIIIFAASGVIYCLFRGNIVNGLCPISGWF